MKARSTLPALAILAMLISLTAGCGGSKTGTLLFAANGEDFVRQGFVDKDGWSIAFDTLLVNLSDVTAYSTRDGLQASLAGEYLVDLALGGPEAEPLPVGTLNDVPAGNYQSLKFRLKRIADGRWKGHSVVMTGTATKSAKVVPFAITLDEELLFDGAEGYVGDELKGMVQAGDTADVEMTFHFDHIFGDIEASADDHINTGSVGFGFFNRFVENDRLSVQQSQTADQPEYATLVHAIWTLGHLGEGHCEALEPSTEL